MTLTDIIRPENIVPEMKARNRWEAIDELISRLAQTGTIPAEHKDEIAAAVHRRERSMSTGIGFGVGLPHASTPLIEEVVAAFGRSRDGIEFDSLDGQPVKLVMLFLVPQGRFQDNLHTLAAIAKMLHRREIRRALEEAPDQETIYKVLRDGLSAAQQS